MRIPLEDNGYIIVAPVTDERKNLHALTDEEREQLRAMGSASRRNEWSTWRRIVREETGKQTVIGYDRFGAPEISGSHKELFGMDRKVYISVSHSRKHVAVMFSPVACGIDIESTNRNFGRVTMMYISPAEMELPERGEALFAPAVWCAKEAAYKFAGQGDKLDIRNDIKVTETDLKHGLLHMALPSCETNARFFEYEGELICYLPASN